MKILVILPKMSFLTSILNVLSDLSDFSYNKKKDVIKAVINNKTVSVMFVSEAQSISKTKGIKFDHNISYTRKSTPEWLKKEILKRIEDE